jgi:hypothetical protein
MNIFYIDKDPIVAAQQLSDPHIRKMQIESAQMCCTAHWAVGGTAPYRKAHLNHPSTIWTRQSIQHYDWLVEHGLEICREFTLRYDKHHKTQDVLEWLQTNKPNLPNIKFVDPPLCMPDQYKKENAIQAYRTFYVKDKLMVKGLDWKKIPEKKPLWVNEYV